jgi:hypothetical protein
MPRLTKATSSDKKAYHAAKTAWYDAKAKFEAAKATYAAACRGESHASPSQPISPIATKPTTAKPDKGQPFDRDSPEARAHQREFFATHGLNPDNTPFTPDWVHPRE